MAVALTLDFVFQIALETEETGELFYESLAENTGDHRIADLCGRMVMQERDHYKKFTKMREHYSHVPPPLEKEDYIQNLINTRVIPTPKLARTIATSGNLRMALDMAIDMEEDSVRLYRELRQEMTAEDAAVVDGILAEEQQHAADLRSGKLLL